MKHVSSVGQHGGKAGRRAVSVSAALFAGAMLSFVPAVTRAAPDCTADTVDQNGYSALNQSCTANGDLASNPAVSVSVAAPAYNGLSLTNTGLSNTSFLATGTGALGYTAPLVTFTNNGTIQPQPNNVQEENFSAQAQSLGAMGTGGNYHGGSAGAVTAVSNGAIITPVVYGVLVPSLGGLVVPQVAGVWAQSIGGAGYADKHGQGNGGQGGAVTVTLAAGSSLQFDSTAAGVYALSAGGQGPGFSQGTTHNWDSGGNAGNVTVTIAGSIGSVTEPEIPWQNLSGTEGVYALSVGGSSGATDNKDSKTGGNAGTVNVTLSGKINMWGDQSIGIVAASAGGLGWYLSSGASNGHHNGNGGDVSVILQPGSAISTHGELAMGIAAFSNGGNSNTTEAPPDSLENGGTPNAVPTDLAPPGNAGTVTVTNAGTITTQGNVAIGIAAVSSSGGRGFGLMQNNEIDQVGNIGPGSGSPGTVDITNSGSINTNGVGAIGLLGLSVGGSGGVVDSKPGLLNLLGSHTAGSGTDGNTVTLTDSGQITTQGAVSMGVLAESIGGGGGTATGTGGVFAIGTNGGSGGNGGAVYLYPSGASITTAGDGSFGILAHSIGGGGGNGANAAGLVASVGGAAGASGNGGQVWLQLLAAQGGAWQASTAGDFAPAVGLQSIGGGGGNGGFAKTYAIGAIPLSAAVGGAAGSGGAGGEVDFLSWNGLNPAGMLSTSGEASPGLLAQSVGGGGGNGGAANTYDAGAVFTAAIAVGGGGGKGGAGGAVNVESSATIKTGGIDSAGVIAQSVGGGGGHAGAALAKSEAIPVEDPPLPTISVSAAIGGSGGAGGNGGMVAVQNDGTVSTQGNGAVGMLIQSIGGGGGDGGDSTAMARAVEGSSSTLKVGVAIGGAGKAAGDGGFVQVVNGGGGAFDDCTGCGGSITTAGNNAAGLIAQSIGGGGGTGGTGNAGVSSPNLGGETGNALDITYGMGGTGGAGGNGGAVSVGNAGGSLIRTAGSGAQGILAQSIGGGGGSGGGGAASGSGDTVVVNISLGENGGSGGTGGNVTVTNAGRIVTGNQIRSGTSVYVTGGDAVGILAQSIGGGGGVGGSSDAAANITGIFQIEGLLNSPSNSYGATVAVGGKGGTGGDAGTSQVTSSGDVVTLGARAYGILAQSIGGGGGTAGAVDSSANSVAFGPTGPKNGGTYQATVAVGGSGGAAGNGNQVTVNSAGGGVFTAGYGASALIAQSIGGGGGVGAEGTVNNTATIGLGGGWSGSGGVAGNGGVVNVTGGALTTLGDDAYGLLAQSIGGGGGLASVGCSNTQYASVQGIGASICFGNPAGLSGTVAPWNDAAAFTLNLGGRPGSSGNGGTVSVDATGALLTTGARAIGIAAQSIGLGGGIATASAGDIIATAAQATPGQNGGAAGTVQVTLEQGASITTSGPGAWGILAQSISGGGGLAGDPSLNLAVLSSNTQQTGGNATLNAGQVHVTLGGNIITSGANAHGVVAQSIGGGGGIQDNTANTQLIMGDSAQLYSSAGGTPGQGNGIYITQTGGTIQTSGVGAVGILAQSSGTVTSKNGGYTQPIYVTIGGSVTGGTNNGYTSGLGAAGIVLSGGGFYDNYNSSAPASTGNFITVNAGGAVGTMDGAAGTAILTNDGYTSVTNNGTITGSITLGATPGSIANEGVLNAGPLLVARTLSNGGTLNVGGQGLVGATDLTGDFVQTASGRLDADINSLAAQQADLFTVAGTAQLGGVVVPMAAALLPGSFTILQAGTVSSTATAQSFVAFTWHLASTATALTLTPSANFTPQGVALDTTQQSLGGYLGRAWSNADPALARQFGYLSQITTASQYVAALDNYSAKATQGQVTALLQSEGTILGSAMSCPVFTDDTVLLGEDNCVWAKLSGQASSGWADRDPSGFHVTSSTYRLGAQHTIAPDWFLGGSFGAGQTWANANGGSSGSGTVYDGSIALKHTMGHWLFAGSVAVASGAFQTERLLVLPAVGNLPTTTALEQGNPYVLAVGGRLRGAYEFTFPGWYIRPYGDLDLIHSSMPGFREYGTAGYALNVHDSAKTNLVLSPMVEFGGRYDAGAKTVLRPFMALGMSFWPANGRSVESNFVGAAADGTFQTYVGTPDVLGNVNVGVQLYRAGGFEMKAEYDLTVGGTFVSQGGIARLAYHF